MRAIAAAHVDRVRWYVAVNPNDTAHALAEIDRCVARRRHRRQARGGPSCRRPAARSRSPSERRRVGLPVLHHIWQHRRRHWPSQDASDGVELARLAERHPSVNFILAHIGGGGDYRHTFAAVRDMPNVYLDLSGSGVDRGMLDDALRGRRGPCACSGAPTSRCAPGLAKLWALEVIGLTSDEMADVQWRNAARIFTRLTIRDPNFRRFPILDRDRRQRVHRRISVPAPAASRSRRARGRARARRIGGCVGWTSAVRVPSRSRARKRRAVSGARAVPDAPSSALRPPRLAALGARARSGRRSRRSRRARLSAAVGTRRRTIPACARCAARVARPASRWC